MPEKYAEFKKFGAKGGKQKGVNHKAKRVELLELVRKQVKDKEALDLIQDHMKNDDIIKLLRTWGVALK